MKQSHSTNTSGSMGATDDILVWHHPLARSIRPLWLLKELGVPCRTKNISLEEFKGQEHLEKNPNGQLPTLELNGEVMWESGAIMQILLEKFDTQNKLEPAKGSPLRGQFLKWMWYAESFLAELQKTMYLVSHPGCELQLYKNIPDCSVATPYQLSLLKTRLALVDDNLKNQGFIVGVAFSAADIQLVYTLNLAQHLNLLHDHTHALKYLQTHTQRPSFERFRIEYEPEWDTLIAQLEHRDGQRPNMNWEQIS